MLLLSSTVIPKRKDATKNGSSKGRCSRDDSPVGSKVLGTPDDAHNSWSEGEDGAVAGSNEGGDEEEEGWVGGDEPSREEEEAGSHDGGEGKEEGDAGGGEAFVGAWSEVVGKGTSDEAGNGGG